MVIGIYTNTHKDAQLAATQDLSARLCAQGFSVLFYGDVARHLGKTDAFTLNDKPTVLLTLGGDGTILRIVSFAATHQIPILGLNLGNLGFLTAFEKPDVDKLVAVLKSNNYQTESRAMLRVRLGDKEVFALNEVVLARSSYGKMVNLDAFVNGEFVDHYFCDGFIVATPTGSTAYSLSAGGSIVSPSADALALTPIAPHSLHARPMIVGGSDRIELSPSGETSGCAVIADGNEVGTVKHSQSVLIEKSPLPALFLKPKDESFFKRLLCKLNSWSVTDKL